MEGCGTRCLMRRRWASMLVSGALGAAAFPTGCAGACSAGVGFNLDPVAVPSNTVACTLTLVGPSNQASYDCPAPPMSGYCSNCTAQGSAPPIHGSFSQAGQCPQGGSGALFELNINDTGSQMRNYLGGSSFSLTLTCDGVSVTQVQGQFGKAQYCEG
jgi:hypothetical protein